MPVPKKKTTKSARNQRRSHHKLSKPTIAKCKNCGQPVLPHNVCQSCGFYKGKQVIEIINKEEKKLKKKGKSEDKKDKKEEVKEDKSKK